MHPRRRRTCGSIKVSMYPGLIDPFHVVARSRWTSMRAGATATSPRSLTTSAVLLPLTAASTVMAQSCPSQLQVEKVTTNNKIRDEQNLLPGDTTAKWCSLHNTMATVPQPIVYTRSQSVPSITLTLIRQVRQDTQPPAPQPAAPAPAPSASDCLWRDLPLNAPRRWPSSF